MGLAVVNFARPFDVPSIYEIMPDEVIEAIGQLDIATAEAIVITGTGMATHREIESYAPTSEILIISSNQGIAGPLDEMLRAGSCDPRFGNHRWTEKHGGP